MVPGLHGVVVFWGLHGAGGGDGGGGLAALGEVVGVVLSVSTWVGAVDPDAVVVVMDVDVVVVAVVVVVVIVVVVVVVVGVVVVVTVVTVVTVVVMVMVVRATHLHQKHSGENDSSRSQPVPTHCVLSLQTQRLEPPRGALAPKILQVEESAFAPQRQLEQRDGYQAVGALGG